jgi:hypothetical protein
MVITSDLKQGPQNFDFLNLWNAAVELNYLNSVKH